MTRGHRIVITAFGSPGDLHPYLAVALGLRARGHEAIVATNAAHRRTVEALGLAFHAVRPDAEILADPDAMRHYMDPYRGTFRVLREILLPALRDSYEDTRAAAEGADLLVSHPLAYAARLVAETRGIPWASTTHTPTGLFSATDPPLVPGAPGLSRALRPLLGPVAWDAAGRLLKRATRSWAAPVDRLRAEIGLPPAADHPLVEGHSPGLHLALFSGILAPKQPDWPPQTVVTGFPFLGGGGLPTGLSDFLDAGPPPLVLTLGATAAMVAGRFFAHSVEAAGRLGRRAVLVLGDPRNRPRSVPDGMIAVDYAPFAALFPRAAAIVHAGGISTTGLAMRAGRPMLVVPHAHDQFDNAERLARLGVARTLSPRRYTPGRVAAALRRLLDEPAYGRRAAEVGERVRAEDGVRAACDALEGWLVQG